MRHCCCCSCGGGESYSELRRDRDEWRAMARKYGAEKHRNHLQGARRLAEEWRIYAHADYWLLYYIMRGLGVLDELPEETVAEAYKAMRADRANERANEIRPITSRYFEEVTGTPVTPPPQPDRASGEGEAS